RSIHQVFLTEKAGRFEAERIEAAPDLLVDVTELECCDGTILVLPYERQIDDPDRVRLDELPQGRRDLACEPVARERHDHVLDGADLFHHYLRFSAVMPYNLVVARFARTP